MTNTKTYAAVAMKSALIKDQRATGRTKGVGATEPPLKTPLMQSSIQEPTGQPMGITTIKPGMLTREELRAALCEVLGIQKPPPVQTEAPVQAKAICVAYKHSRMPARQIGFKPVQGNKKPTIGTNDNHHIIPPKNQLMRSCECFHCHKSRHYARHCRTKCRADQDHPGTTVIKATSAQVTKPGLTTANRYQILSEEVDISNDPTPAPCYAPKLLDAQRIKDLIAENLWKLSTDEQIKLAGEARKILKVPPGARPTRKLPRRAPKAQTNIKATNIGQADNTAKPDKSTIISTLKDETVDEEIRIAILERVMPNGFKDRAKLAAMLKTLKLTSVYFSLKNYVQIKFPLAHYQGETKEEALLDSGATENFIDANTVKRLKLGTKLLKYQ